MTRSRLTWTFTSFVKEATVNRAAARSACSFRILFVVLPRTRHRVDNPERLCVNCAPKSQKPSQLLAHVRNHGRREVTTNRSGSFLLGSAEPFERFLQVPSVLRIRLGVHRRDGSRITAAIHGRDDGSRHARAVTAIRVPARQVVFRAVHRRWQVCGRVDDGFLVPLMVIKAESGGVG